MSKKIKDLNDLLNEQVSDIYVSKQLQLKALSKWKRKITSIALKDVIEDQIENNREQVSLLKNYFKNSEQKPMKESANCMKSLIKQGNTLSRRSTTPEVKDAGIITSLQHINHYDIASYGTAATYASELKQRKSAKLFRNLNKMEKRMDKNLTKIAKQEVNLQAII